MTKGRMVMRTGSKAWRGIERLVAVHHLPVDEQPGKVVPSACGHCSIVLDRATHDADETASPGDLSVCWNCAGVNRFDADLVLKPVRDEDLEALDVDHGQLAEARALIRAALTRNPRKGTPQA